MRTWKVAAWVAAPPLLLVLGTVLVSAASEVPTWVLLRDPAGMLRYPPWWGAFSHLAVLLWAATAAICLFAGSAPERGEGSPRRGYFLAAGLLTAALCLDDWSSRTPPSSSASRRGSPTSRPPRAGR